MSGPPVKPPAPQLAATVQVGGRAVGRDVFVGIHDASRKTGMDFAYMLAKANQESGLRPDAANRLSSARGLFQFTRETWLEMVRKHGASHGLADLAGQIERDGRGRLRVADEAAETRLLNLRQDPRVSALMAAEFAGDNRRYLEFKLGRTASAADIYTAHFLGPGGAVTFLQAVARTPDRPADEVLPVAARSNPGLFYRDGEPRSVRDLQGVLNGVITDAMRRFGAAGTVARAVPPPPGLKPAPPPPEDMGHGRIVTARAGVPLPPDPRPLPPGFEDMGRDRMASADGRPPVPSVPGVRPVPPGFEDMGADRLAAAAPPGPPGPRPAAPARPLPDSEPVPTRIAGVDSGARGLASAQYAADPADGVTRATTPARAIGGAVESVAGMTEALEAASRARGVTLPGPSALAVAALLDALEPASDLTPTPTPTPTPPADPGLPAPSGPGFRPDPDTVLRMARQARPLFDPPRGSAAYAAAANVVESAAGQDPATAPPASGHGDQAGNRVIAVGPPVSAAPGERGVVMRMPGLEADAPADTAPPAAESAPPLGGAVAFIADLLGRPRRG